jgi:hypothetical protein
MNTLHFSNSKTEKRVVLVFTFWGLIIYLLGYSKLYASIPRPFFGMTAFLTIAVLLISYFQITSFKRFLNSVPLRYLALFQAWRIFAGMLFLSFRNQLPAAFIHEAPYGDIVTGFMGIAVFVFLQNKMGYFIVNIVGLADLIIALSIGLYYALSGEPKMVPILALPLILIPLFGVPIAVLTHVISFSQLIKAKKKNEIIWKPGRAIVGM